MASVDIGFYLSVLKRRLPLLLAVAAVPAVGALAFALLSPPVYRASAMVMVVSPRIPEEMARSTVSDSAVGRFHLIERELTTAPALVGLARQFKIYPADAKLTLTKTADDMRSRLVVEQFWLDPSTPAAPAFAISFDADSAALAADVANHLATSILEEDKRRRTDGAAATMDFFRQNVDQLSAQLAAVEGRILTFRNDHLDALPDSLDFRRNQQEGQSERLTQLEREESALRSRRFNLTMTFQNTGRVPSVPARTPDMQALADLQAALVTQQAIYTDDSPAIVALKARIERLQAGTAHSGEGLSDKSGQTATSSSFDMQLAEIDDQLQSIATEKDRIAQASTVLAASISETASNETGLNVLDRERDNIQSQYNAAVARLAQASTGEQVENDLKGERLVMLEEATAPQSPVRPKRTLIVLGGLGLGLGGAIALMVLMELLNRSIRRPADLQKALGMEPLMALPYIATDFQIVTRRVAIVAVGILTIAIPAAIVISVRYGLPVSAILGAPFAQLAGGAS